MKPERSSGRTGRRTRATHSAFPRAILSRSIRTGCPRGLAARGAGLTVRLKRHQRQWWLAQGTTRIRWTFDPLRAANAALNMRRLAATANTYLEDYCGEMEGINRGLASDRLLVDRNLESPVVGRRLSQPTAPAPLSLPQDLEQLAKTAPDQARDLRGHLRDLLRTAFADGYRIVDFDPAERRYLLAEQE